MDLTRRHALAGAAALAATPLLPNSPAKAAAPLADKQAPSFYRYMIGEAQVTAISDGMSTFALPDALVLNAKKDEVAAALDKAFLPKDKMSIHFSPLVINTGGNQSLNNKNTSRRAGNFTNHASSHWEDFIWI